MAIVEWVLPSPLMPARSRTSSPSEGMEASGVGVEPTRSRFGSRTSTSPGARAQVGGMADVAAIRLDEVTGPGVASRLHHRLGGRQYAPVSGWSGPFEDAVGLVV